MLFAVLPLVFLKPFSKTSIYASIYAYNNLRQLTQCRILVSAKYYKESKYSNTLVAGQGITALDKGTREIHWARNDVSETAVCIPKGKVFQEEGNRKYKDHKTKMSLTLGKKERQTILLEQNKQGKNNTWYVRKVDKDQII